MKTKDAIKKINFYPEKRGDIIDNVPVILSVAYSGNRMFYYTGKRCNISQWNYEDNKLKRNNIAPNGQTSTSFNADLTEIEDAVDALFNEYVITKTIPTVKQLREDLKIKLGKKTTIRESDHQESGFFDWFDKYIKDADLSAGRKKHLNTTLNKVRGYDPNTTFEKLDTQYLTDFRNHLLGKCNLSKNTVISELRRLRAFYSYAQKNKWTNQRPFEGFQIGAESFGDPVFITIEERDLLYNATIENDTLRRVRDIFVFQCFIGCRVGDLVKLKKSNIIDGCIQYIAGKTKDEKPRVARIPLTEKALTILSRYEIPNGDLLPYYSDQKYNKYIKDIFKLDDIKITRMVTIADPKTRKSIQKSIADLASSHMARRVFVSSLYKKGVKNEIIASMSGHSENSRAFGRYHGIDQEDQTKAIKLIE